MIGTEPPRRHGAQSCRGGGAYGGFSGLRRRQRLQPSVGDGPSIEAGAAGGSAAAGGGGGGQLGPEQRVEREVLRGSTTEITISRFIINRLIVMNAGITAASSFRPVVVMIMTERG